MFAHELRGVQPFADNGHRARVADVAEQSHDGDQPNHREPDQQLPLLLSQLAAILENLRRGGCSVRWYGGADAAGIVRPPTRRGRQAMGLCYALPMEGPLA